MGLGAGSSSHRGSLSPMTSLRIGTSRHQDSVMAVVAHHRLHDERQAPAVSQKAKKVIARSEDDFVAAHHILTTSTGMPVCAVKCRRFHLLKGVSVALPPFTSSDRKSTRLNS